MEGRKGGGEKERWWREIKDEVPFYPGGQHGFVKDRIGILQC